jgi:hypothetical protein
MLKLQKVVRKIMIEFPWKVKRKIQTPAEVQLEQIKSLLFPQLITEQELSNDGTIVKFHVDYSLDSNLDAALIDLQEGHNDEVVQGTINEVVKKLIQVRRMLEAYAKMDPEAKYIIVENPKNDSIENID